MAEQAPARKRKAGKRENARVQFKDQWLGKEPGRQHYFRYWYDASQAEGSARVRRKTLGTDDLDEATLRLYEIVHSEAQEHPEGPDAVPLVTVLNYYLDNHVVHIRAQAAAKRACALVQTYLKTALGRSSYKVADFNLPRQEAFMKWCVEQGLKPKSIATYMSSIKAAVNFAVRPRLFVDSKGVEREGRMLSAGIFINADEGAVAKITGRPRSTPRTFSPTLEQMARFIDAIDGDGFNLDSGRNAAVFRYMIIALNTWARPEAITDLNVDQQVDFQRGLVDLLPPGRAQNKKFRPTIRLTDNLRGWLLYWNAAKPIMRGTPGAHRHGVNHGRPVKSIPPQTFRSIAISAGLPQLTRYTVRHFLATQIRAMPGIPVSIEERAMWLGHVDPSHRQTQWYERFDADHLANAARATDAVMDALDQLCTKSLRAPGSVAGSRLSLVTHGIGATSTEIQQSVTG